MKKFIYLSAVLLASYMLSNITSVKIFSDAQAKVAGMNSSQLEDDDDFKDAVEDIIEDCEVEDGEIDC